MRDVRWKQRLENFTRAVGTLESALKIDSPDIIQKAGIIQFFEMSFELAWNTVKDYLESQGFIDIATPRKAIKKAFQLSLIADGELWLKGLEDRNLTPHTYNEHTANEIIAMIRESYFPLFEQLIAVLDKEE